MARPAASSRSTAIRSTTSQTSGRDADARGAGRGLHQGAGHVPRDRRRRTRCSPTRSSSTSPPSCPRSSGPKRPQDRVVLDRGQGEVRRLAAQGVRQDRRSADRGRRGGLFDRPRRRGDRRHHLVHQYLEPLGAGRRRPRRPQGAGAGAQRRSRGSRPRWRRARRWSPTISTPPACRTISTRSGFNLVGYGCTTCIGNSGPLPPAISEVQCSANDLVAASVLSGNRNFEGRVNPDVRANYPRLAAAGRRLRARRLAEDQHHHRAARHRHGRQAGLSPATSGRPTRRSPRSCARMITPQMFLRPLFRRLQGRRALAGHRRRRRRDLPLELAARPMCRTRPISRA